MTCTFSEFIWSMLIQVSLWEKEMKQDSNANNNYLLILEHHAVKSSKCLSIDKLTQN